MKIFECEFYQVTCPDGGGMRSEAIASFINFADAETVANRLTKETNWPHSASKRPIIITRYIFESVEEWEEEIDQSSIRRRALAKLSDAERKVLGL